MKIIFISFYVLIGQRWNSFVIFVDSAIFWCRFISRFTCDIASYGVSQESWYNRPGGNPAWKNKSKSKNIFSFKASISKKVSLTIKRGRYRDFFLLSFPSTFFCI